MIDLLNKYQKKYLELSAEFIARATIEFYKNGGQIYRKISVGGHRIPCYKCGRNARRHIPNEKPICEKCWQKGIAKGLNGLFVAVAFDMVVDSMVESLSAENQEVIE